LKTYSVEAKANSAVLISDNFCIPIIVKKQSSLEYPVAIQFQQQWALMHRDKKHVWEQNAKTQQAQSHGISIV
jgi:hypothetical protein